MWKKLLVVSFICSKIYMTSLAPFCDLPFSSINGQVQKESVVNMKLKTLHVLHNSAHHCTSSYCICALTELLVQRTATNNIMRKFVKLFLLINFFLILVKIL